MFNLSKYIRKIFYGDDKAVCVDSDKSPYDRKKDQVVVERVDDWMPGEPVENMVRAFERNHRRFIIKRRKRGSAYSSVIYDIVDRQNGESYRFRFNRANSNHWFEKPEWMSNREVEWAYLRLGEIAEARYFRYLKLKRDRRNRQLEKQRQRIINLYKED